MKKSYLFIVLCSFLFTACGPKAAPGPAPTPVLSSISLATATETLLPLPTVTPTVMPTLTQTPEGVGPVNFPAGVNPLTGLKVADPTLLERRPMLIKVPNLPRFVRPQWGLSLADIIFEYYTEEGTTRFASIFYGNDAATVGPIRSGRFIDMHLVRGYKAIFAFGFADPTEMIPFQHSDFADRIVVEVPGSPMKRVDPNGANLMTVSTSDLSAYVTEKGVENGRQDLSGMQFKLKPAAGGTPLAQVFVHYSGSIYNRWDYDAATGKYLRFVDNGDVFNVDQREWYVPLTDRLTKQQLAFDNVVVLYVEHKTFSPGIYDIFLIGMGQGYANRDGQIYPVNWSRENETVINLDNPDGTPFYWKPGTTWFEVVGQNTVLEKTATSWRFDHKMP